MNTPHSFKLESEIFDYHCDKDTNLKPGYLLKFAEAVSTAQLIDLGLPYKRLFEEGVIFLMTRVSVKILRMPVSGEKITLVTAPREIKGARFFREVKILDSSGTPLVFAVTNWFLANPHTRRVLKPDAFVHELKLLPKAEWNTEIDPNLKFEIGGQPVAKDSRKVRYSDLDINGHVNNSVYADIVFDALPRTALDRMQASEFVINYKNEAKPDEILELTTYAGEDGKTFSVEGVVGESICFNARVIMADKE